MTESIQDNGAVSVITNSIQAERTLHGDLDGLDHEEAWIIHLTSGNRVIGKEMILRGALDQTSVDCRIILRHALLKNSAAMILLHNHPSGNPEPSRKDIEFTEKLKKACDLMEVGLLDHIIVGDGVFYSFADEKVSNTK